MFFKKLDIHLLQELDSSGPAAWDPSKHPKVFIMTEGPGYGGANSKMTKPGIAIFDEATHEVVVSRQYDLGYKAYFEPHGLGVSADGKWIYLPTGDTEKKPDGGHWIIIDAKTLKIHQIISTRQNPHHAKVFVNSQGNALVAGEDFNWQAPGKGPGSGIYVFDPSDDNRIVGGINADTLQASPYLAFPDPTGKYMMIGLPPGSYSDLAHEIPGTVAFVDTTTWQPVKYLPIGKDPIWTVFSHDGKYAWVDAAGDNKVVKIDLTQKKVVGETNSGGNGPYGMVLSWDEKQLWLIDKGEASHNRGMSVALVDPDLMKPMGEFPLGAIRVDHGTLDPDPAKHEIWITSNASFDVIRFDLDSKQVTGKMEMPNGGSTHSGSFVQYNSDFTGQVLSDMSGLHGDALKAKDEIMKKSK